MMTAIARAIYSAYATCLFACVAFITGCFILTLPRLRWRRRVGAIGMRTVCALAGIRFRVEGQRHLPAGPAVVVANHMSYLDGLIFTSALPSHFGFVIKMEASKVPIVATVLRRMGAEFVDRHDKRRASSDTRRLLRRIQAGRSLGFFPEGTVSRTPGLRPFRLGAFLIAARAGVPVVPAAVEGTRGVLPPDRWRLGPGHIRVNLLPALNSEGSDKAAALALRDAAWDRVRSAVGSEESAAAFAPADKAA
jgi:1-acyl-sn-glycerol-3-phosphate acyltransferase